MKVLNLKAKNYRSLRDVSIKLEEFNLFIGANAAGKSTILDALRFLHEAVHARDFEAPVFGRGGILNLAWKGEQAHQIDLAVILEDGEESTEWSIQITRQGHHFHVGERVARLPAQSPPVVLLEADGGTGWWWSGTPRASESRWSSRRRSVRSRPPPRTRPFPRAMSLISCVGGDSSTRIRFCSVATGRDWIRADSITTGATGRDASCPCQFISGDRGPYPLCDSEHRRSSRGLGNPRVGRPLLFCAVGDRPPVPCASDGGVQRDITYAGADDGAPWRTGGEPVGDRGAGELHSPERVVRLR